MYFFKEDIMCFSEKRIQCVFLLRGYNVYFCEEDIVCFPGRGYTVQFGEENIVCLSEKRI